MPVNADEISARASSLSRNSSHNRMEIGMRSASDKKNEEKLSLVQNAV